MIFGPPLTASPCRNYYRDNQATRRCVPQSGNQDDSCAMLRPRPKSQAPAGEIDWPSYAIKLCLAGTMQFYHVYLTFQPTGDAPGSHWFRIPNLTKPRNACEIPPLPGAEGRGEGELSQRNCSRSRHQLLDELATHIRQPKIASLKTISQLRMLKSEQPQQRRVQIMDVD